jgi:hypothetical protein
LFNIDSDEAVPYVPLWSHYVKEGAA